MRLFSLPLLALLLCSSAFAQKPPIRFGDIPIEDMKMTAYPLDQGAEAVVLADYGVSEIDYNQIDGFYIDFERTRRVKILTKEGLKHAEFNIPLWRSESTSDEEKLSGLKLVTYNLENGKIVETKVNNESFFKEKYDKNLSFMKGAWTNVKEGSIIEITYKIRSDFLFNFQDWEFQSTIPVRWSEYRAKIPEYFNYQRYMQGYVPLAINENVTRNSSITLTRTNNWRPTQNVEFKEENFRWVVKEVPAFKREPFTTSNDYLSKINFELAYTQFPNEGTTTYMGTWEDINTSYWAAVKNDINSNAGLKDDVERIIAGATSDDEKAVRVFAFVRANVMWDGRYRKYPDNNPRKTMDARKGSSAEINLLLACMLDKAGLVVSPVLLSTRDHGFVRESIPVSSQFNYVACAVKLGNRLELLDATDPILPFAVLPERCLNGLGLVVNSQGTPLWVSLVPTVESRTTYKVNVALAETGQVKGTLKIDKSGYASANARRKYHSVGEGGYFKEFSHDPVWTFSDGVVENANEINLPFKESYQVVANEGTTTSAETIYFNPFILSRIDENPFKSEKRQYPVDFGNRFEEMYFAMIAIPEGYVVEELPVSKVFGLSEGAARYTYSVSQFGNVINLTSSLSISRSYFAQDVYPNLREFFDQVVAKQSEQIVLKKK